MKRESPGKPPAEPPPTELPSGPTDAQLRFRRRMVLLVVVAIGLAIGLFVWLFEEHHTVTVALPESGATLTFSRVHTYIGSGRRNELAVDGVIGPTAFQEHIGGTEFMCVAEGRGLVTGDPLVRVSHDWGIVWLNLRKKCLMDTIQPTRIDPRDRLCPSPQSIAAKWQQLGRITNVTRGEPVFEPGTFKKCSDEWVHRYR